MSEDAASPAASTPNNAPADFHLVAAKAALTSSSTTARISQLRSIEEKISQKCERPNTHSYSFGSKTLQASLAT